MGDVIEFDNFRPSSFTINATMDTRDMWNVTIVDFYNSQMPISEVYREIAEALIPIAGGFVENAEEIDPTKRGCMVVNVAMYEGGAIDFHSRPFISKERLDWFLEALDNLRRLATEKYEQQKDMGQG